MRAERALKKTGAQKNDKTTSGTVKINQIVRTDRRMSIWMIAEAINTDKEKAKKNYTSNNYT